MIATPCPLLLAIPVAIVGGISLAARRGIIIRDPAVLERVDRCRTLIFDKTGTLTHGRPVLVETVCAPGHDARQALRLAASLEQYSKHPLAMGLLRAATKRGLKLTAVDEVHEIPGQGLRGRIGDRELVITGRKAARSGELRAAASRRRSRVRAAHRRRIRGTLPFSRRATEREPRLHPASETAASGAKDHAAFGRPRIRSPLSCGITGIPDVHFGKSPEEKVAIVEQEARQAPTLFVGDGINDAPAMLAATVGVAFGRASDVTAEAASAVILESSLEKVDELMHIGRRMRTIALQSAVAGMLLSVVGMSAAVLGYLPPIAGVLRRSSSTLLAVANALRVALTKGPLSDWNS